MIFGNDRIKQLILVLFISVALFAASIVLKVNLWITVALGIVFFITILAIALYGYEDEN
jgi:type IV secretory pathway TrbD component